MDKGEAESASGPAALAREYRGQLLRNGRGHYNAAQVALRKNRMLGGATVLVSAIAGSTLLTTKGAAPTMVVLLAGGAGLIVSAMAGLQTYLNYGEVAAEHIAAGRRFATLRKEFDLVILRLEQCGDFDTQLAMVDELRMRWEQLAGESPLIPGWADRKAVRELAGERQTATSGSERRAL